MSEYLESSPLIVIQLRHCTPSSRILPSVIGSIGWSKRVMSRLTVASVGPPPSLYRGRTSCVVMYGAGWFSSQWPRLILGVAGFPFRFEQTWVA
jgi:hypothetical protein